MGVMLKLSKPVDGKILRDTVERLRERFPYFYVRAVPEGNDLIPVENPLPMTVRNTWVAIRLNAEESNFHLAAWKYEGQRVAFEISHSLTDGAGVLPYIKSAMYLYLSQKTGEAFAPAGFRLPGDKIPESETGNPFPDLDIDSVEEPIYQKKTTADFYRLNRTGEIEPQIFYLKLPEAQVIEYCRDNDGSPNVFCSVMLAKAARRCDPEGDKTISVAVAIDHKAMLGNHDNYRMFANVVEVDFPKSRSLEDVMKACTIARGQIMLQAQPELKCRIVVIGPDFAGASIGAWSFYPNYIDEHTMTVDMVSALDEYAVFTNRMSEGGFPSGYYSIKFFINGVNMGSTHLTL